MNHAAERLLIRPAGAVPGAGDAIDTWLWWRRDGAGGSAGNSPEPPACDRALLLVPAGWMHIRTLGLPTMAAGKLARAVPYALEEYLAGDVDRLHVVHGRQQASGAVTVAAIEPALLDKLLQQLASMGIEPHHAIPDALCLPWQQGSHSLMPLDTGTGREWLLRSADGQAFCLQDDELDWLQTVQDTAAEWHYYAPAGAPAEPPVSGEIFRHAIREPLQALAGGADSAALDLLHGRFQPRRQQAGAVWRRPLLAAAAVLLLATAHAVTEYFMLQQEYRAAREQVETLFRQAFPDITTIVNPRVQAERALAARQPAGSDMLLHLLQQSAPVLAAREDARLVSLDYSGGELRVQLRAGTVTSLDELLASLRDQGLAARLEGVTSSAGEVRGGLVIGTGAGTGS